MTQSTIHKENKAELRPDFYLNEKENVGESASMTAAERLGGALQVGLPSTDCDFELGQSNPEFDFASEIWIT